MRKSSESGARRGEEEVAVVEGLVRWLEIGEVECEVGGGWWLFGGP
jgi:hypothetical protein